MENLTKTQIILLALFVSFVTSIATGIVTVTLVDQAPPGVTQTINRVVERTVERVVPSDQPAQVKEVVSSADDLIARAISQASPAVVSLYSGELSFASGFVVAPGVIATFGTFPSAFQGGGITVRSPRGGEFAAEPLFTSPHIATFKISGAGSEKIAPLKLSTTAGALGRTVAALALDAEGDPSVALGVITAVRVASSSTTPSIKTNLSVAPLGVGGPVVDTRGSVIGLVAGETTLVPAELIKKALDFTQKNP